MSPEEIPMTEEESLSIITGMINRAKNRFSENGTLYLLWGWVIFLCSSTQFVLMHFFNYPHPQRIWGLTWLAVIYQFIYLAKRKKRSPVKTYTDEIIAFVWITFVICGFLLVYILLKQKAYESIDCAILVLYGMPTFLSGKILKFKPLSYGGIICWLIAFFSPFVSYEYQLLLISAAVVAAWMIPGYLLRAKFIKEN